MIRVVIADDHAVVRHGLAELLATFEGVELAGEAADGEAAVALCARERPEVVLMDIEMPAVDGIEATRRIKAEQPDIAVVVLTSFSDRERILQAIDAGAAGYLLKDVEPAELEKAIESAARGEAPLDPRAARAILGERRAAAPAAELSDREREVLMLVAEGLPNKLIARRLDISEKTVKAHLTSVFKQIGVTDRTQAALWAEAARPLDARGRRVRVRRPGPASSRNCVTTAPTSSRASSADDGVRTEHAPARGRCRVRGAFASLGRFRGRRRGRSKGRLVHGVEQDERSAQSRRTGRSVSSSRSRDGSAAPPGT